MYRCFPSIRSRLNISPKTTNDAHNSMTMVDEAIEGVINPQHALFETWFAQKLQVAAPGNSGTGLWSAKLNHWGVFFGFLLVSELGRLINGAPRAYIPLYISLRPPYGSGPSSCLLTIQAWIHVNGMHYLKCGFSPFPTPLGKRERLPFEDIPWISNYV